MPHSLSVAWRNVPVSLVSDSGRHTACGSMVAIGERAGVSVPGIERAKVCQEETVEEIRHSSHLKMR